MDLTGLLGFNVLVGIGTLALITVGLGVIYGMMKIINLAHGEFMMLGAYATYVSTAHGINIWIAMLIISPLFVGLVGLVVERTLIRFLYGRMIDTMLATWGLSLGLIGLMTSIFGNDPRGVSTPLHSFAIGRYDASLYGIVIILAACASLVGLFAMLRMTRFGLIVRATMQNPNMAAALGVCPAAHLHGDVRAGSGLRRSRGRCARTHIRRVARHGSRFYRQSLHHCPRRRCGHRHRHRDCLGDLWLHQ